MMTSYGQYCPMAQALELIGDRWTLLIVRDLLTGTRHFNDLERGLPGISRALLARRLRQLEVAGIIEKRVNQTGRKTTEYHLTAAGSDLQDVINALLLWGAVWAFGEPTLEQLDPVLLMWWMHNSVHRERLPKQRVVVEFNFRGTRMGVFWLVLMKEDVLLCLTDPGYEIDVLVTSDLSIFFQLWLGRIAYDEAIGVYGVKIEGTPQLVEAFPEWFTWSLASDAVRAGKARQAQLGLRSTVPA